jgi:membrane-associated protease RseP (regulator of RpoE activity)
MFLTTVGTVFWAGAYQVAQPGDVFDGKLLVQGWVFAVPLLAILLAHEFGHYIAARLHGVPASLPFFIPMVPWGSPLGTLGAVISMRDRIKSRDALVDIGAAGPLAGMVVALPVLVWGLLHSPVQRATGAGMLEGESLLYLLLKRVTLGPIPAGYDVMLHPVAFAGWAGLFLTMINLVPVGQLDGGHIAYALFGPAQNHIARMVHGGLAGLGALIIATRFALGGSLEVSVASGAFWLVWFGLLFLLKWIGGRDHPPTEPGELGTVRKIVAAGSLLLFVLLFMPTPLMYAG